MTSLITPIITMTKVSVEYWHTPRAILYNQICEPFFWACHSPARHNLIGQIPVSSNSTPLWEKHFWVECLWNSKTCVALQWAGWLLDCEGFCLIVACHSFLDSQYALGFCALHTLLETPLVCSLTQMEPYLVHYVWPKPPQTQPALFGQLGQSWVLLPFCHLLSQTQTHTKPSWAATYQHHQDLLMMRLREKNHRESVS